MNRWPCFGLSVIAALRKWNAEAYLTHVKDSTKSDYEPPPPPNSFSPANAQMSKWKKYNHQKEFYILHHHLNFKCLSFWWTKQGKRLPWKLQIDHSLRNNYGIFDCKLIEFLIAFNFTQWLEENLTARAIGFKICFNIRSILMNSDGETVCDPPPPPPFKLCWNMLNRSWIDVELCFNGHSIFFVIAKEGLNEVKYWSTRTTTSSSFLYWACALQLKNEHFRNARAQNWKLVLALQSEDRQCLVCASALIGLRMNHVHVCIHSNNHACSLGLNTRPIVQLWWCVETVCPHQQSTSFNTDVEPVCPGVELLSRNKIALSMVFQYQHNKASD